MAVPKRKLVEIYQPDVLKRLERLERLAPLEKLLPIVVDGFNEPAGQGASGLQNLDFSKANVTGLPGLALPASFGAVLDNNSVVAVQALANGQLIIGNGVGVLPTAGTLTPGNGISIANAAGSITLTNNISAGAGISITGSNPLSITNTSPGPAAALTGSEWIAPWGNFASGTAVAAVVTNRVHLILVYIPFTFTVNRADQVVITGVASAHFGSGFYTFAGSQASATLLGQQTFSSAVSSSFPSVAPTAYTLTPGFYWWAYTWDTAANTVDSTSPALAGTSVQAFAAGHKLTGDATNTSAAGVLPATTGTINAFTGNPQIPCTLLGV